jgi:hypothetical protein
MENHMQQKKSFYLDKKFFQKLKSLSINGIKIKIKLIN